MPGRRFDRVDNFTERSQFDSGDDLEICDEFIILIGRKKKRIINASV